MTRSSWQRRFRRALHKRWIVTMTFVTYVPVRSSHLVDNSWKRIRRINRLKISSSKSLNDLYSRSIHPIVFFDSESEQFDVVDNTFSNSGYSRDSTVKDLSSWPSSTYFSGNDIDRYPLNFSLRENINLGFRRLLSEGNLDSQKFIACPLFSRSLEKTELKSTISVVSLIFLLSCKSWCRSYWASTAKVVIS